MCFQHKTNHCRWIKDATGLIGPIKCLSNLPPSLLRRSQPPAVCEFYWWTQRPLWVTAASQLVFALPGVTFIDIGLWVRTTVTGYGHSKEFSEYNGPNRCAEQFLSFASSIWFWSFFFACSSLHSSLWFFSTVLYKDHLSIKVCGRCCCCLCPWIFCWWTSEFLYALLCLSSHPWLLLMPMLTIQLFLHLF